MHLQIHGQTLEMLNPAKWKKKEYLSWNVCGRNLKRNFNGTNVPVRKSMLQLYLDDEDQTHFREPTVCPST